MTTCLSITAPRPRRLGVLLCVRTWIDLAQLHLQAARRYQNWRGRLRR
ncbi:hypothetical protein Pla175_48080 [Pirellulimonas nuda]|uniref:Uncharacterized protein n=1 Tax=Pirellulimonas nuda TaxID=2528009 RepID=A0A518DIV6_9BACT|nr:hypothetical protein [Pirellulimonas nuda]QDU91386.1 hypothetical protein Pla175_48080 [Pirellulimonas nuda]